MPNRSGYPEDNVGYYLQTVADFGEGFLSFYNAIANFDDLLGQGLILPLGLGASDPRRLRTGQAVAESLWGERGFLAGGIDAPGFSLVSGKVDEMVMPRYLVSSPQSFYGDGFGENRPAPQQAVPIAEAAWEIAISKLPTALQAGARIAIRASGGTWARIPGWLRSALLQVGVTEATIQAGQALAVVPPTGAPGSGIVSPGLSNIGVSPVGTWVANGVTFYRLSDGRLAVQNKQGRWKVWRPKRPIVLMPSGATNLVTLLRADAVLNRQAKKIAAMLHRRAGHPRARRAQTIVTPGPTQVVQRGG